MKKFFYSVVAASMLFATSCSHEDIVDITKGEGQKVTFKVNLPEQAASRAVADGSNADKLIYAMYESGTTEDATEALICGVVNGRDDNDNFTVTVPMAKDIEYDLLFLAYNGEKCAFVIEDEAKNTDLRALQFKSSLQANEDAYDAFVGKLLNNKIIDEKEVELTRPFAQVNAATTNDDWVIADETLKSAITHSYLHMSGVPSAYNVFEGKADGDPMEVDFIKSESPIDETLNGYTGYKYLTFAYVLAGDENTQSTATAQFEFYRANGKKVSSLVIPNFPLERNHRTNVIGSLLTQYADYKVSIDASIGGDEKVEADKNTPSVKDVQTSEDWEEVAALLNTSTEETISIKLGGIANRSADDKGILAEVPAIIHANKTVIFDLNGYTLKHECEQTTSYAMIENNGTLTIINSASTEGKIEYKDKATLTQAVNYASNTIKNNGKLTIEEGVTIVNNSNENVASYGYPHPIDNNGELVINGGTFTNNANYSSMRIWCTTDDNTSVTINGGTFNGSIDFQTPNAAANKGTLTINDGTFIADTYTNCAIRLLGFGADVDEMNGYIKGGNFNGEIALRNWSGSEFNSNVFTISGGTFSVDPSDYLAEGYKAEKDENGIWTISQKPIVATIDGQGYYTFAEALSNASDNATIQLVEGEYILPSNTNSNTLTIKGTEETVIDVTKGSYIDNATLTFEGITIKTSTGYVMDENGNQGSDYAALYSKDVTYLDCNFIGPMRLGRDGARFINCTFSNLGNDYVWTNGNDVTFEECTFNTDGKAILIYNDGGNEVAQVSVKNCTFNATQGAKAGAIANQNCAAIEIHNLGNGVNLTTNGNTYDSNFSGEWRIKTYETGKTQVFVNGTEYTTIALDGKTMTIDADRNVTFSE